jgi:hypothetical protein
VLHLSAGKTGGDKRGNSPLERAVDAMLKQPGIILVQSVGNYANAAMHAHARVGPDQRHVLEWITPENDRTPNELEIWYSGEDVFDVTLISPEGREFSVALGNKKQLGDGMSVWGNFYHRLHEPNSGLNHIVIYLYTAAPNGRWRVVLHGRDVVDGRLHAWIERDASGRWQSRFSRAQASSRYTTNTICNCFRAIAVGAYDGMQANRPPTVFSSRGPTADGRQKPEIAAPGYRIKAARSMPRGGWHGEPRLTVKSGTSMAAPWVSGTVALMMQAAGRPLSIHEIRRALIGSVDPHGGPRGRTSTQLGYGYLNTAKAVAAARRLGHPEPARSVPSPSLFDGVESAETAFASVWVEDAASVPETDQIDPVDREGLPEPEGDEQVFAAAETFVAEDCGCGGHRKEAATRESGVDAESGDEGWDGEFDGASEQVGTPFVWEDIQEALEAVDESDG